MRRRTKSLLLVFVLVAGAVAAFIFGQPVVDALFDLFESVDSSNVGYIFLFFVLTVAATNPVVPGYALVLLGIGFIYEWWGLPLAWAGSVGGGVLHFAVARWYARRNGISYRQFASHRWIVRWKKQTLAVESAINKNGLKIATLLQFTWMPFGLVCVLLGVTKVHFGAFVLSACISRLKITPYIWLATTAKDLADVYGTSQKFREQDILLIVLSTTFSITSLVVISYYARRILRREVPEFSDGEEEEDAGAEASSSGSGESCSEQADDDGDAAQSHSVAIEQQQKQDAAGQIELGVSHVTACDAQPRGSGVLSTDLPSQTPAPLPGASTAAK